MASVIHEERESREFEVRHTHIEKGDDVESEVQNHLWADAIILQSPVYWFGTPWIDKKYIEAVFTAGMVKGLFITGDGRTRENASRQ